MVLGRDLDLTGHTLDLDLRVRVGDGLRVIAAGLLDRRAPEQERVVRHVAVELHLRAVVLLGILLAEGVARGIDEGNVVDDVGAVHRVGGVEEDLGRAAVAAEHRHLNAEGAGLLVDHDEILIEDGGEDDLGLRFLDLGQLRGEVGVAGGVALIGDDGAALGLKDLDEVVLQTQRVVVVDVVEDGGLVKAEVIIHERTGDLALLGIEEADAEVVFLELTVLHGDLLVGRHGGHIGDLVLVEDGLDGDALTRGVRADDRADLILRAQTLGDVDRLLRVALGVVADQLDLLAEQSAVGVEVFDQHLEGLAFAGAVGGLVAGERAHPAELDGVAAGAASVVLLAAADEQCREHQAGEGESNELLHGFAHGLYPPSICCDRFPSSERSGLAGMDVRRAEPAPASMPSILDVYDARERQMNCKGLMSKITPRRVIVKSYHEILAKRMIFVQNNKNDRIEARKAAKKTLRLRKNSRSGKGKRDYRRLS